MVEQVIERLEKAGFSKLHIEQSGLYLYLKVISRHCFFVNIVDYRDPNTSGVNTHMLEILNGAFVENYLKSGFEDVRVLNVIVTYSEVLAEELAGDNIAYWVMNSYNDEFVIPEGQPATFCSVEVFMRQVMDDIVYDQTRRKGFMSRNARNDHPQFKLFILNNLMVLINVVVYFVLESIGTTTDSMFMLSHGAFYLPAVQENGEIYRFFTCMFIHFGFSHLFSNMVVLFFLGDNLERAVGKVKYLLIYILSGLGASFVSCFFYYYTGENVVAGGASGAIFGVVGALIYIVTANRGKLEDLDSYRLIIFAFFSLYSGFTSSGVDNAAHVGGFVLGIILGRLLYKKGGRIHEG